MTPKPDDGKCKIRCIFICCGARWTNPKKNNLIHTRRTSLFIFANDDDDGGGDDDTRDVATISSWIRMFSGLIDSNDARE